MAKIIEDRIEDRYSGCMKNGKGPKIIEDMIEDRYSMYITILLNIKPSLLSTNVGFIDKNA